MASEIPKGIGSIEKTQAQLHQESLTPTRESTSIELDPISKADEEKLKLSQQSRDQKLQILEKIKSDDPFLPKIRALEKELMDSTGLVRLFRQHVEATKSLMQPSINFDQQEQLGSEARKAIKTYIGKLCESYPSFLTSDKFKFLLDPLSELSDYYYNSEMILNRLVNAHVYERKVEHFIEKNLSSIITAFTQKGVAIPESLKKEKQSVEITIKAVLDGLATCHNGGQSPVFVTLSSENEFFTFVLKPRHAHVDEAVINTFKKINEQEQSEPYLPEYAIINVDKSWQELDIIGEVSLWECINGKTVENCSNVWDYTNYNNPHIQMLSHNIAELSVTELLNCLLNKEVKIEDSQGGYVEKNDLINSCQQIRISASIEKIAGQNLDKIYSDDLGSLAELHEKLSQDKCNVETLKCLKILIILQLKDKLFSLKSNLIKEENLDNFTDEIKDCAVLFEDKDQDLLFGIIDILLEHSGDYASIDPLNQFLGNYTPDAQELEKTQSNAAESLRSVFNPKWEDELQKIKQTCSLARSSNPVGGLSKEDRKILQQRLIKTDSLLTQMGISDQLPQNFLLGKFKDKPMLFPIDLEVVNRRKKNNTQTGVDASEHPKLTEMEPQFIELFSEAINQMHLRILPLATRTMVSAAIHGHYKTANGLASSILDNLGKEYNMTIPVSELEKYVLLDLLNGDVPYVTEVEGEIYYGSFSMQKKIGKQK